MAEQLPTRLHLDPPIDQWQVTPRNGRTAPVIATGHQPYFWHSGILAKYLAADAFAQHVGGAALNVVVEHNPIGPLTIDVPIQANEIIAVARVGVDRRADAQTTPINRLDPVDGDRVFGSIAEAAYRLPHAGGGDLSRVLEDSLSAIGEALAEAQDRASLSEQVSDALDRLIRPLIKQDMPRLPTSRLVTQHFVDRLLADPVGCVRAYNLAAATYPEAGIRPLYLGRDVVELPLWAQNKSQSTPVYADLGDSHRPQLFTQGQTLDLTGKDALQYLRPRAITLSVIMRSEHCDLFIHGTGGGVYDQVTEQWWGDWVGEPLAPMAVVSADLYLPFEVPVASQEQLNQAVWFDHHLPFNVDRFTQSKDEQEQAMVAEKRELLAHMNDDRDKRRRAKAFKRIHEINATLRDTHQQAVKEAEHKKREARIGVRNSRIAQRRDWCFALYPERNLRELKNKIELLM